MWSWRETSFFFFFLQYSRVDEAGEIGSLVMAGCIFLVENVYFLYNKDL